MRARGLPAVAVMLGCLAVRALAEPPDARAILAEADAAVRAVRVVRYHATGEATGALAVQMPKMEGTVTLAAIPGVDVPRLRLEADVIRAGQPQAFKLQIANDGKYATLADYSSKVYARREMPGGASLLGNALVLFIRELALNPPFERESKAMTLEHVGIEKVGDVECDVIRAVLAQDGGEVRWHFARTDHLPRRVQRIIETPSGPASFTTSISTLEIDPKIQDDDFRFEKPADFRELPQQQQPSGSQRVFLPTGSDAPDWSLKTADGREVSLKSLRGKIVLLDFWATWCAPCRMAMPGVQRLHEKYKDKPVAIFGVNCWERDPDPAAFMKKNKLTYPILLKGDAVAVSHKVAGIPTFYLIGPDGKILLAYSGMSPDNEQRVDRMIEETLKKLEDKPAAEKS